MLAVLSSLESYPFTLISDDTLSAKYTPVIIRKSLSSNKRRFVFVATERSLAYYKQLLSTGVSSPPIDFIDEFALQPNRLSQGVDITSFSKKINDALQSTGDSATTVVLDSLSMLAMRFGLNLILAEIAKLLRRYPNRITILSVVHRDAHDETHLALMKHYANAILNMSCYRDPGIHKEFDFSCECLSMRSRSKLLSAEHYFKVDPKFPHAMTHITNPLLSADTVSKAAADPTTEINRQVTFKLGRSQKEQEDKDNTVLPYVNEGRALNDSSAPASGTATSASVTSAANSGKGVILFDAEEEYDLEDPDDDLDI